MIDLSQGKAPWGRGWILFFVGVKTCCIYLGSRPYKEDYQVSRISHKGCRRPLAIKVFQCSNIEDFQTRMIELTSNENSEATHRSYDFCMT